MSSGKEAARRYGAYFLLGLLFIALLGLATAIAGASLGLSLSGNLTDLINGISNHNGVAIAWSILSAVIIGVIAMISIAAYPSIKKIMHSHEGLEQPKFKFKVWATMGMGFLIALELWFIGLFVSASHVAGGVDAMSLWQALQSGQLFAILAIFIVVPLIALSIIRTAPKAYKVVQDFEKKEHIPDVPDNK